MDKCRINIAVIEPSQIIYEGLSNILLKSQNHFFIYRLNDLEELGNMYVRIKFNIVLINPTIIQNKVSDFIRVIKILPEIAWIGLVYSFFDDKLLNKFDVLISVTDTIELITQKINNAYNNCNCVINNDKDLTKREIEVLTLLTKGMLNKEIANKLNISIHTAISHRKNIVEKTGIKSLSGLTIYAISKNIIPIDTSVC